MNTVSISLKETLGELSTDLSFSIVVDFFFIVSDILTWLQSKLADDVIHLFVVI